MKSTSATPSPSSLPTRSPSPALITTARQSGRILSAKLETRPTFSGTTRRPRRGVLPAPPGCRDEPIGPTEA